MRLKTSSAVVRRSLYAVGVLVLGALGVWLQGRYFPIHKPPPPLTVAAKRGDIETAVVATGTLQPKELVSVGAQVTGQIRALKVAVGDKVAVGQLIAEIDSATEDNALKGARATLTGLEAQRHGKSATLALIQRQYDREKALFDLGVSSRDGFEIVQASLTTAQTDVESLDQQIVAARIALNTAEVNVGYTRITAPIDGVVVAVVTKQGQTVNSIQAAPTIVLLAKLDVMEVKTEISEADVDRVAPGQKVYFTTMGAPDHRYWATLASIDPVPESLVNSTTGRFNGGGNGVSNPSVYYSGRFDIDNPDGKLRAEMTVEVNIVQAEAKNVVTIPSLALQAKAASGKDTVEVLDAKGKITKREVKVGLNNNVAAEIAEGLEPDEKVVVHNQDADGMKP